MTTTAGPEDRVMLLSQAIDPCQSLASVLQLLGPKQASDILRPDEPSSRQQQIHSLEDTLDQAFRAAIEARNLVLAPISRVTDDVLRLFFLQLQRSDFSSVTRPLPSYWSLKRISDLSYTLSFVCRRWRNMALDTAPLWSHLSLNAPPDLRLVEGERNHPRFQSREGVISRRRQLSLARSRDALLSLEINIWGSRSVPSLLHYFNASCANRVKDLTVSVSEFPIHTDTANALQVYNECVQSTAATLTKLALGRLPTRAAQDDHERHEDILASLFSTELPLLHEATLNAIPVPNPPRFTILTSCRVLTMHCSPGQRFTWECYRELFSTCGQLEDVTLVMSHYDASIDAGPSSAPICMRRLHTFKISYQSCAHVAFPFTMLLLPRLRTLHIWRSTLHFQLQQPLQALPTNNVDAADNLTPALLNLIRGSPLIESLSVQNLLPELLLEAIPHLYSLRVFALVYVNGFADYDSPSVRELYVEVITALVHPQESSTSFFLPTLESLVLGSPASMDNLHLLHDFLEKRKAADVPLRALRFREFPYERVLSIQPSLEEAYAAEEKVAALVDSLSITEGNWYFNKEERVWKQRDM